MIRRSKVYGSGNQTHKKKLVLLFIVVLAISLLTGCGKGTQTYGTCDV